MTALPAIELAQRLGITPRAMRKRLLAGRYPNARLETRPDGGTGAWIVPLADLSDPDLRTLAQYAHRDTDHGQSPCTPLAIPHDPHQALPVQHDRTTTPQHPHPAPRTLDNTPDPRPACHDSAPGTHQPHHDAPVPLRHATDTPLLLESPRRAPAECRTLDLAHLDRHDTLQSQDLPALPGPRNAQLPPRTSHGRRVPGKSLTSASSASSADNPSPLTLIDRAVSTITHLDATQRRALLTLARRRLAALNSYNAGVADEHDLDAILNAWTARESALADLAPSLFIKPRSRTLARAAQALANGNVLPLLGKLQPRAHKRMSTSLQPHEETFHLQNIAHILTNNPHAPIAVVHRALAGLAIDHRMTPPPPSWTRRHARTLLDDHSFTLVAKGGPRALTAGSSYIARDKTAILPGAVYVVDHRQFDVEVVAPNGNLVRPWLTLIVDQRTLLPIGHLVLESAPNGDSVMLALSLAMLPTEPSDASRAAGIPDSLLATLCGAPDDAWYFDNGKDFSGRRIEGTAIAANGAVSRFQRRNRASIVPPHQLDVVLGLMAETGARIQRAKPFNARAKVVERVYRDISQQFDSLCPGYVGNTPTHRPHVTEQRRRDHARLLKACCTRREIAAKTGYLLLEEFVGKFESWLWTWTARTESRAQGLLHDGRQVPPLELWATLAPARRVPARETLLRLSLIPDTRRVTQGGVIRLHGNHYQAHELLAHVGANVVVRHSPLDRTTILVEQLLGHAPLPHPLRVPAMALTPANADRETLSNAIAASNHGRKDERARIKSLSSNHATNILDSYITAQQHHGATRGIVAAPPPINETVDLRTEVDATPNVLPAPIQRPNNNLLPMFRTQLPKAANG